MIRTVGTGSASALRALLVTTLVAAPLVFAGGGSPTQAATGELLISEYVEGSSFNKAIEVYNGTGAAVDLSTYELDLYSNGAAAASQTLSLSGSLADGDVWIAAHSSADPSILAIADATSGSVINWNGDDGIVLRNGAVIVDSFGQSGVDPGSEWSGGGQNDTLVRKASVCVGDTDFTDAFDASVEWDVLGIDDFSNLGSHTADCGGGGGGAALLIDCGPDLVAAAGTAETTTVSASDADDTVVSMTLDSDDVSPVGSLTAGTFTPSAGVGGAATLELQLDASADAGVYAAMIQAQNSAGDTVDCDLTITVVGLVRIHDVQGAGDTSPLDGSTVIVEGIVVGDFQDGAAGVHGDLNGFFVQEEDSDADTDPLTSEGVFVFDGSNPTVDVMVGDLVRVEGDVSEFGGLTEITSFSGVSIVSSGNPSPTTASLSLPLTAADDFEAFEGMSVTFPQDLVISEYFNFDRFNEIVLSSQRNLTPTAVVEPGAPAIAAAQANLLDRITLDDGRTTQNPDPAIHPNGGAFDLTNLFRGGDTVTNATGVMHQAFGLYRIQPTQGADYDSVNPRSAAPDPVGGSTQVATFNVLNYFTTLDDSGPICGPAGNQDCRGADNAVELNRQRDKIVAAIAAIDADVVGLLEIENHPADVPTADLVAGLNAVTAPGTYAVLPTGAIGTDAIRVAVIYKPANVSPSGAFAVLDSSVDSRFIDTKNRPALAQTFVENGTGAAFTVAVNHLKSKGSDCSDVGDPDTGEGADSCNGTRTLAAAALVDWLAGDPTGSGDSDMLIIGDLNSYDKEDPIDVLKAGGYTDLVFDFVGEDAYSYVFDGQIGYLDYQLANGSLAPQVTGTTVWHINADEADLIDYDTSFKQPAQDAIYAPDPYRSSDHDPVIVGLALTPPAPPEVLVVVGKVRPNGMAPGGDQPMIDILEGLGANVMLVDDDDVVTADADGKDLVVIASSVAQAKVGTKFTSSSAAVASWEGYLFDELRFNTKGNNRNGETKTAQTVLDVVNDGHPMSAGYSGVQSVSTSATRSSYSQTEGDAIVIAKVGDDPVLFGFEAGATMAGGFTAPARRVGMFPTYFTPTQFTPVGTDLVTAALAWALGLTGEPANAAPTVDAGADQTVSSIVPIRVQLDATVDDDGRPIPPGDVTTLWTSVDAGVSFDDETSVDTMVELPGPGVFELTLRANDSMLQTSDVVTVTVVEDVPDGARIAYVASTTEPPAGDAPIVDHLRAGGADVMVIDDDDAATTSYADADLLFVSTSVEIGKIGDLFKDSPLPMITTEQYLLDDNMMAVAPIGRRTTRALNIESPGDDLAAGFVNAVRISDSTTAVGFATPAATANVIASVQNKSVYFAYEAGTAMVDGFVAPADRIFFPGSYGTAPVANSNYFALLDAAVVSALA